MSAPTEEGVQDDDDILGFPGDGFEDKTDANLGPGVLTEQDEEGDEAQMQQTSGGVCQGSDKKRKKTDVVPTVPHREARHVCLHPVAQQRKTSPDEKTTAPGAQGPLILTGAAPLRRPRMSAGTV